MEVTFLQQKVKKSTLEITSDTRTEKARESERGHNLFSGGKKNTKREKSGKISDGHALIRKIAFVDCISKPNTYIQGRPLNSDSIALVLKNLIYEMKKKCQGYRGSDVTKQGRSSPVCGATWTVFY